MTKTVDIRSMSEVRKAELADFARTLGMADIACAIERPEPDNGEYCIKDYTAERGNWLDDLDFDEVLADIREMEKQRKQKELQAQ
ncbi:MAG: hypothetical protein FWG68_00105 [Defluviitaleaceae bacterium]|nr:hypothetical protein [Defluviitaleaceae bacterium]